MPVGPGGTNPSRSQPVRETFRPPWVKEGPQPIPMPSQPWVKANRNIPANDNKQETATSPFGKTLRRVSQPQNETSATTVSAPGTERKTNKVTIFPSVPKQNGTSASSVVQQSIKNVESENSKKPSEHVQRQVPPSKISEVKIQPEPTKKQTENVQRQMNPAKTSDVKISVENNKTAKPTEITSSKASEQKPAPKEKSIPAPPKPPPLAAPPPPPPPGPPEFKKSELTPEKKQKLEALRSRPKKRPDWGNILKEIETGRKLNHIQCNDRSAPLLPKVKAKGQFVYESERPNLHNQLLKQIETGIRLKPTKTNDRSKPFIEGLRKFRRQMTIEEQIQKSASMASLGMIEPEPDPLDEVDDIDKVRDDLQSTKQLLAIELKNKEALQRENKKLVTKILNLEVELEKERNKVNKETPAESSDLLKEIANLKEEAEKARKLAEDLEAKYHDVQAQYDLIKLDLDESQQKNQRLEKQLKVAQAANLANLSQGQPLTKQPSKKIVHQNKVQEAPAASDSPEESEEEEEEETETETEIESEDDENEEAQKERRLLREIKLLQTKLDSFKKKQELAKKERKTLKENMNKLQKAIKEEKKKYKVLQKEVDKMSKLMNEGENDDEELEDEEQEVEEESSEEDEETEESESEESEDSEGDLPENSPPEKKKVNLQTRTKKYENLLSSLKKGNYLLKANVDRYKDELNKQKEMALTLQEDLNSVLAELG